MFWASLWDMVRDARLGLDVYLDSVLEGLPGERNDKVILQMTGNLGVALSYLWRLPEDQAGLLERYGVLLESLAFDEATAAPPGGDLQTLWADTYRRLAHTPTALRRLESLSAGDEVFPGYAVDQDRRWWLLHREIALGASDVEERITAELERDPSDSGEAAALGARASQPSLDVKGEWLDRVRDPDNGLSLSRRRMIMSSLFPVVQTRLHDAFAEDILDTLTEVGETHQDPFLSSYGHLIPGSCSPASVARLAAAIAASSELHPILMKALRIAHQEDARCVSISNHLRQGRSAS
jgi:aminopeptidase N